VDHDASIQALPSALEGRPALARSRSALLRDSGLNLRLEQPTRVVAAFGRADAGSDYLLPPPGWQRGIGGFAATDAKFAPELFWRDVPAGKADLLAGCRGAWAVVAVLPQPRDLASGAKLEASSVHDGIHLEKLAVDGNAKTEWWSKNGLPQWLMLDLNEPAWLNRVDVIFYHQDKRYYQYVIETSMDGKAWNAAVDAGKNKELATAAGTAHGFPRQRARYVRITVCGSSEIAAHIAEVRLFDDPLAPAL
jgi:hypothetical protein